MRGGCKNDTSCVPYQCVLFEHFINTGQFNFFEFDQLSVSAIILNSFYSQFFIKMLEFLCDVSRHLETEILIPILTVNLINKGGAYDIRQ
jgi:hypothetical protein